MTGRVIEYPKNLHVAQLEGFWASAGPRPPVRVDLSRASGLTSPILQDLIARLVGMDDKSPRPLLILPAARSERDSLRRLAFPSACALALQRPFETVLMGRESREYVGELKARPGKTRAAIQALMIDRTCGTDHVAAEEADWWRLRLKSTPLAQAMGPRAQLISKNIIYVALKNSLEHSNSQQIQFSTLYRTHGQRASITVTIWDDGLPIPKTLSARLRNEGGIYPPSNQVLHSHFKVRNGDSSSPIIMASTTPLLYGAGNSEILLASTFPGVSSDATRDGLGLSILIHTLIGVFGGRLYMRTQGAACSIKGSKGDAAFRARLRNFENDTFRGNLLRFTIGQNAPVPLGQSGWHA